MVQKQWITWGMLAVLIISSLMFIGARCKPDESGGVVVVEEDEDEVESQQRNQGTPVTFTKESLEKAGVPVYPSTEDAIEQDVTKDGAGSFHGTVFLVSSTCPPENVQRFYDSTLRDMPGYSKEIIEGSAHYKFILENGDQVTLIITSAGQDPMAGSNITTIFN